MVFQYRNVMLAFAFLACGAARASQVGGHVGAAVTLAQFGSQSHVIGGDFLNVAVPIGVTIKGDGPLAIDLETILAMPLQPGSGKTGLVIDPGVVYNWGAFATGGRVAFQLGETANIGFIPLINKGFPFGARTFFIEAALPMFVKAGEFSASPTFHTGIGF
jgi:hypothetical protein